MYPYSDELYVALLKERHAEIQRAFERYGTARTTRATRPSRLSALLQRLRRRTNGAEQMPRGWSEHAGPEERCSA
jgi:hypothetical protein